MLLFATKRGKGYMICLGKALIFMANLWTTIALRRGIVYHRHSLVEKGKLRVHLVGFRSYDGGKSNAWGLLVVVLIRSMLKWYYWAMSSRLVCACH